MESDPDRGDAVPQVEPRVEPRQDDALLAAPDHGPVPAALHSSYSGVPFERCLACDQALADAVYQIHKAMRGGECVLEAALCLPCLREMSAAYSEASLQVLREFQRRVLEVWDPDACGGCGAAGATLDRFSRIGVCRGDSLLRAVVVICAACEEQVQGDLSVETREAHDEFVRGHFPGIPADLDWESVRSRRPAT